MQVLFYRIRWNELVGATAAAEEEPQDESDDEDEDEDGDDGHEKGSVTAVSETNKSSAASRADHSESISMESNACEVVWQGIVPKRLFVGLKFQVQ
jgi:uncharacterized membrane protein